MFSEEQRAEILKIARSAIYEYVRNNKQIEPPDVDYLRAPSGVFVTLMEEGELRGCIGYPEAMHPLGEALVRAAVYAATDDPRFPRVTESELPALSLDVSILSAPWIISDPAEIEIGKHGLILTLGRARGLLLPQVAVEHRWNRLQFLSFLCRKAGVREDAWKDPAARLEVFTAEVFGEEPGRSA